MAKDNHIGTMLITGNGFDLNLGMKTGYKDFFLSDGIHRLLG